MSFCTCRDSGRRTGGSASTREGKKGRVSTDVSHGVDVFSDVFSDVFIEDGFKDGFKDGLIDVNSGARPAVSRGSSPARKEAAARGGEAGSGKPAARRGESGESQCGVGGRGGRVDAGIWWSVYY